MEFLKLYDEENRDILYSMSWLNKNSIFDKSVGSFQEIDLFTFLENINDFDYDKDIFYDDVYYILEYTKDSILHLINNINREIKREHKIVPISQAKEFDKKTILWLSRQDGRTIKEKLKNNKIKAVKRYSNIDTYENRVFKIFLKKLILIDEARREIDNNDYLIGKIRQWLRSDDARAINEYGNIVYNNILLHHPHYSKIFKSYKWVNRLDEKVDEYINLFQSRKQIIDILKFEILSQIQFKTDRLVLPSNIKIDWEQFDIKIHSKYLLQNINIEKNIHKLKIKSLDEVNFDNLKNMIKSTKDEVNFGFNFDRTFNIDTRDTNKVFIDLFRLFPIAKVDMQITNFPITLLQDIESTIVNANNTKVINLNHKIYTLPEILKTYDTSILRIFLENLEKYFKDKQLNYIIPDYINIFEFSSVKKAINSYFPSSRNIPKSILAGLKYLFDGVLQKDDTLIYIQKNHDNDLYVTPLLVKYDKSLQSITNGLYLEKHPTKKLKDSSDILNELNQYFESETSQKLLTKFLQNGIKGIKKGKIAFYLNENIIYLNDSKNLSKPQNRTKQIKSLFINKNLFKKDFIEIKDNNEDNLNNFEKLLQYEQDGYNLWKEHLPKLTMGNILMPKGYFGEFVLVDDNSEVLDRCIDIQEHFNIPPNVREISFPLVLDDEDTGYEAFITSNEFPLKNSVECELKLTYNYENETPYELKFLALDGSIKPLKVIWRKEKNIVFKNLPIPPYPSLKSWEEFKKDPRRDGKGYSDLLDWILERLELLNNIEEIPQFILDKEIERLGTLNKERGEFIWGKFDKNNKYFCFVKVDENDIFCHSSRFIDDLDVSSFYEGMPLYLEIETNNGKLIGKNISLKESNIEEKINNIKENYKKKPLDKKILPIVKSMKSLKYPLLTVWNNHSLTDSNVPNEFRIKLAKYIQLSLKYMQDANIPISLKNEILFFLSSIHQDMPVKIANTLVKFSKDTNNIDKYQLNIALAIGSTNLEWQRDIFKNLLKYFQQNISIESIVSIYSIASWRSESFISTFSLSDLYLLTETLIDNLFDNFNYYKKYKQFNKFKSIVQGLELLLGILRARSQFPDVLKPNSIISKKYMKLIDTFTKYCILNNMQIRTRIKLAIDKPESFKSTPDLLYALRAYLSGDSGATNTIQILGVSDD